MCGAFYFRDRIEHILNGSHPKARSFAMFHKRVAVALLQFFAPELRCCVIYFCAVFKARRVET